MSKPFSAFYNYLLPDLPGCTTSMIDQQLVLVARDFCDRTSCWRDDFPTIDADANQASYFVSTAEPKTELVRVLNVHVGDEWLWSAQDPKPDDVNVPPTFAPSRPPFKVSALGDEITFDTVPADVIALEGSMKPQLSVSSLPDLLLMQHLEAMCDGVFARLMRMGNKPWTNPIEAAARRHDYEAAISRATYQAARGNTRAQLRSRATLI